MLVVNWQDRENPQAGGAEVHLHEIFGRLVRDGAEVTLLCSGFDGGEPLAELDGLRVHRVGRRYTFPLHARRYWRRHLAARPFDVLVEDLNKVPLFTPRWGGPPVVPLVHHLFGLTAFQEANAALAAGTWLLERPLPLVYRGRPTIAVSHSTAADLVRRGLRAGDIEVIPNGVDLAAYEPLRGGPGGAEPLVGRFDRPTLLFVGRLKRYKRLDLVLDALPRLVERGIDVRLVVAGKGDALDALREHAAAVGVADRVDFEGFVDEARKRELLRRSWVHVLTSPKEGWGISNVEAAASGTPTVASDAPGLRESVRHGATGYLVPHGDVAALADRLAHLLERPDRIAEMGREARAFAEGFSWDGSASRVGEVLRRVAGRFPPS